MRVIVVRRLKEALDFFAGIDTNPIEAKSQPKSAPASASRAPDMRDVQGHALARRALEVAAAGGHNVLLVGGPGAGKTMLARRLPGLLPPLTNEEALEVTRIHSAAGLNIGGGLVVDRPFRAPHHSTTPPGLVGGGAAMPRPGEVTLAHHGVLFLDELPEFSRATLEMLREPLVAGEVLLSRATGTLRYPSRCMIVASMSPCPCGHLGSPARATRCRCTVADVARYRARVSPALLECFDIQVFVPAIDLAAIEQESIGERSASIAARVAAACAHAATRTDVSDAAPPTEQLDAASRRLLQQRVLRGALFDGHRGRLVDGMSAAARTDAPSTRSRARDCSALTPQCWVPALRMSRSPPTRPTSSRHYRLARLPPQPHHGV
jgi:magnesium chelatase family protein